MNITYSNSGMARFPDGIDREIDDVRMVEAPIEELPGITKRRIAKARKLGITCFLDRRYYLRGKQVWPPRA